MEIARAKLKVYQEVEEFDDDRDEESVEDGPRHTSPIETEPKITLASTLPSQERQPSTTEKNALLSYGQVRPQESPSNADTTAALVTTITDSFSMSRLPTPKQTIFRGEPIQYQHWKSSFHALIHRKNLSASDKMYYLKRYVSGSAPEAISGLLMQNSTETYEHARSILDERFGHPFIVTKAYRDQPQRWPKISPKDHHGLRKFADLFSSVGTAMEVIEGLNILNDYTENQKPLAKLLDWLVSRWNREATKEIKERKK